MLHDPRPLVASAGDCFPRNYWTALVAASTVSSRHGGMPNGGGSAAFAGTGGRAGMGFSANGGGDSRGRKGRQ